MGNGTNKTTYLCKTCQSHSHIQRLLCTKAELATASTKKVKCGYPNRDVIKRFTRGKKNYRSRNDIVEDMLNAALEGTSKTKMMYAAYLSYSQLKEYMAFVLQNGLLEYNKEQMKYFVTAKGREFLRKIKELKV